MKVACPGLPGFSGSVLKLKKVSFKTDPLWSNRRYTSLCQIRFQLKFKKSGPKMTKPLFFYGYIYMERENEIKNWIPKQIQLWIGIMWWTILSSSSFFLIFPSILKCFFFASWSLRGILLDTRHQPLQVARCCGIERNKCWLCEDANDGDNK